MPRNQSASLVFPILLIALGGILLYVQYHPAWDPWPVLATYWPLILIFIGLGKIWDATRRTPGESDPKAYRTSIGSTVAVIAFVFVMLALFWHGRAFSGDRFGDRSVHHETRAVERGDVKSVRVSVESGSGQVTIGGGSSRLLDADFSYGHSYGSPKIDYKIESGVGALEITQDGARTHFGTSHNDWDLRFGNNVPLELKVEMGAGEGRFRLRDVPVTDLQLRMGAGRVDLDLTGERKNDLNVDIQGGVGQAIIRLPKNVGVIANASGGIGSIANHGLKHDGDDYVNGAYGRTPVTIRVKVQGGVGAVSLIEED